MPDARLIDSDLSPTTSQQYYDIVIIGGGPAGASLAALLSPNLRVLVLEKQAPITAALTSAHNTSTPPARGLARIITLSHTSMCILDRMQLREPLRACATPVYKVHISEEHCFTKVRIDAMQAGVPALGYALDSEHLSAALQQHVLQATKVIWQHIDAIDPFELTPNGVHLSYHQGKQSTHIQCRLLIAADGSHSSIRAHAELLTESTPYQQTAVLSHVELSTPHQYCAYERFSSHAAIAFLPFATHSGTVVASVPKSAAAELRNLPERAFIEFIKNKLPFIADQLQTCGPRFTHPLHSIKAYKAYRHGLILIGNAAHTLHPIAAQGFNLALRDIYVLAHLLNQQNFSDAQFNTTTLAEHYESLRRCDQQQIYLLTDFLQNLFMSDDFHKKYLRGAAMRCINNVPFIKTWFTRRCMGQSG